MAALSAEKICPINRSKATGCGKRQNPGVARLGPRALAKTVRPAARRWKRIQLNTSEGQHSGLCSDWVNGKMQQGKWKITFRLSDQITGCTCVAGSGKIMLDAALRQPAPRGQKRHRKRIRVDGIPANVTVWTRYRYLALWVSDRCILSLEGLTTIPEARFLEAARIVDLKALAPLCRKR